MTFSGGAPDHHRACKHETGPNAPYAGGEFRDVSAETREEILIEQKIRLDVDGVIAFDLQVAVLESVPQRVFKELVITMILSLLGECRLPARQAGNFIA
jgi:hypothetical protein